MDCSVCSKRVQRALACADCLAVVYCSKECKDKDHKKHKKVCKELAAKKAAGGSKQNFVVTNEPPKGSKGVREVASDAEFQAILSSTSNLVVVDYSATWCGPCKAIAPFVDELSRLHTDVFFLKVDVDRAKDIAQKRNINSMPTFELFRGGNCVLNFKGANKAVLQSNVEKYKAMPSAAATAASSRPLPASGSSQMSMSMPMANSNSQPSMYPNSEPQYPSNMSQGQNAQLPINNNSTNADLMQRLTAPTSAGDQQAALQSVLQMILTNKNGNNNPNNNQQNPQVQELLEGLMQQHAREQQGSPNPQPIVVPKMIQTSAQSLPTFLEGS